MPATAYLLHTATIWPHVCPGKNLGQFEVALVVGAVVKMFHLTAPHPDNPPRAGVSTKPADGTLVELRPR